MYRLLVRTRRGRATEAIPRRDLARERDRDNFLGGPYVWLRWQQDPIRYITPCLRNPYLLLLKMQRAPLSRM
jgi:hypothetical protein